MLGAGEYVGMMVGLDVSVGCGEGVAEGSGGVVGVKSTSAQPVIRRVARSNKINLYKEFSCSSM